MRSTQGCATLGVSLAIFLNSMVVVLGRVLMALTQRIKSLVFDICFFAQLYATQYTILYV